MAESYESVKERIHAIELQLKELHTERSSCIAKKREIEERLDRFEKTIYGNGKQGIMTQQEILMLGMEQNSKDHKVIINTLKEVGAKVERRPPWSVVFITGGLLSICVGLVVHMLGG